MLYPSLSITVNDAGFVTKSKSGLVTKGNIPRNNNKACFNYHLWMGAVVGRKITKSFVPWCRRGLLADVYNGVSC